MKKLLALAIVLALVAGLIAAPALAAGKNGPAGKSNVGHLYLYEKDPATWGIVDGGAWGKMKYNLSCSTLLPMIIVVIRHFEYDLVTCDACDSPSPW